MDRGRLAGGATGMILPRLPARSRDSPAGQLLETERYVQREPALTRERTGEGGAWEAGSPSEPVELLAALREIGDERVRHGSEG